MTWKHYALTWLIAIASAIGANALFGGYEPPADRHYTRDDGQAMFAPAVQCDFAGWWPSGEDVAGRPARNATLNCEDQNGHEWTEFWYAAEDDLQGLDHGECKPGNSGGRGSEAEGNRTGQWEQWLDFKCDDGTEFSLVFGDSHIFNLIVNSDALGDDS